MTAPLHLFAGLGIELEYMIVDAETLDVRPFADRVLHAADGSVTAEVEHGDFAWSNELTKHVLEFKTNGPAPSLAGLTEGFQTQVGAARERLGEWGATLLPTAMHPWMDPSGETVLWEQEYAEVYDALHRIFDCRGHGWANLQSMHLNLPFADSEEFARLHAAIRTTVPLLPSIAASSPFADGHRTSWLDTRLEHYRTNARALPSITGLVVPEASTSPTHYHETILHPIYAALAPLDPAGVLRHEWVNARGAIARFDRQTIEVRVLDTQESVPCDLAVAAATKAVVAHLCAADVEALNRQDTGALHAVLLATIRDGDDAVIADGRYLHALGLGSGPLVAGEVWAGLLERTPLDTEWPELWSRVTAILAGGCLARRISECVGADVRRERLHEVYAELARCLATGSGFAPS